MDISPEVFVEMWNVLKPYIPQKERFDAAYSMIDFYDTNGDIEELRESDILDSYLAKALNEYLDEELDDDDEDEDDDY
jgi:hypothetical protein